MFSYTYKSYLQKLIDDYVGLCRNPKQKDNQYGESDAYNIVPVHRIIQDALNKIYGITWDKVKKAVTPTIYNVEFIKQNLDFVPLYFEGCGRYLAAVLNNDKEFALVLRKLICDREELGFCFAYIMKDKYYPLNYSLKYIHYDSVEFLLDEFGTPYKYFIVSPTTRIEEMETNKYCVTIVTRQEKNKWKIERFKTKDKKFYIKYGVLTDTAYLDQIKSLYLSFIEGIVWDEVGEEYNWRKSELPSYFVKESGETILDYCPILHSRKNISSDNILGQGSGIMCLSLIKELHNAYSIKKDSVITNNKLLIFRRENGLKNERGTNGLCTDVTNINQSDRMDAAIMDDPDSLLQPDKPDCSYSSQLTNSMLSQFMGHNYISYSSILPADLQGTIEDFSTADASAPLRDQVFLYQPSINTNDLTIQISILETEIKSFFSSNATFESGKSRMTELEVATRSGIDEISTHDQNNPIINEIINEYLLLVIEKNINTLFNPYPDSQTKVYDYISIDSAEGITEETVAILKKYMSSRDYFWLNWDKEAADRKKGEEQQKMQNALMLLKGIAELGQVDQSLDINKLKKNIQLITDVDLSPVVSTDLLSGVTPPDQAAASEQNYVDSV